LAHDGREAKAKFADLEQTMRKTPGVVAYYFLETADGVAPVTVTEDTALVRPAWDSSYPGGAIPLVRHSANAVVQDPGGVRVND